MQIESATAGWSRSASSQSAWKWPGTDIAQPGMSDGRGKRRPCGEHCISDLRRVSFRAPALMRHKEQRRGSPTRTRWERGADVPGPKSGVQVFSGKGLHAPKLCCSPECFFEVGATMGMQLFFPGAGFAVRGPARCSPASGLRPAVCLPVWCSRLCGLVCCRPSSSDASRRPPEVFHPGG